MQKFAGRGSVKLSNSTLSGVIEIAINDDGRIDAKFIGDEPPFELLDCVGDSVELSAELQEGTLRVEKAFVNQVGRTVRARVPHMFIERASPTIRSTEFAYQLVNCVFNLGSHWTENGRGGGALNAIELELQGISLRVTQLDSYKDIVESARERNGAAVTARLVISGVSSKDDADSLATGFCDLFSFATKNTVRWISRESVTGSRLETEFISPLIYPLRTGWTLIPDIPVGGEHQLQKFLVAVLPNYKEMDDRLGLSETFGWLIDSEMSVPIQPKFLLAFAAIERLRSRILRGAKTPSLLHAKFNEYVDGTMGDQILQLVSQAIGGLDGNTKDIVRKKLKDLNRPPISASLDALCEHFRVTASTKKMSHLRSRLMHAGDLAEFKFGDALDLYWELSQVLDVCLLRALGFDGYYHHVRTNWQERLVSAPLDDQV